MTTPLLRTHSDFARLIATIENPPPSFREASIEELGELLCDWDGFEHESAMDLSAQEYQQELLRLFSACQTHLEAHAFLYIFRNMLLETIKSAAQLHESYFAAGHNPHVLAAALVHMCGQNFDGARKCGERLFLWWTGRELDGVPDSERALVILRTLFSPACVVLYGQCEEEEIARMLVQLRPPFNAEVPFVPSPPAVNNESLPVLN